MAQTDKARVFMSGRSQAVRIPAEYNRLQKFRDGGVKCEKARAQSLVLIAGQISRFDLRGKSGESSSQGEQMQEQRFRMNLC